jgi:hypothetical protein
MINTVTEIFSKPEFLYDSTVHTFAVLITAALAFITWLIKTSYDRFVAEMKLLVKIEVYLIQDKISLSDNRDSFTDWLACLKKEIPYTGAMRSYGSYKIDFYNVSNLVLLNKLNNYNYRILRFETDINHNFIEYRNGINKFVDTEVIKPEDWSRFNQNLLGQLDKLRQSFTDAIEETDQILAYLCAYKEQKTWTIFRILKWLNTPIFPKISEKRVARNLKRIQS